MTARRLRSSPALLLALLVGATPALATTAEPTTSPAQIALEQAREAHRLRSENARTEAAWTAERQRLEALIAATEAETARLIREAEAAEQRTAEAEARLAALGNGSDLDALRASLAEAGVRLAEGLHHLAAGLPPGAVAVPSARDGEAGFDAAVRALEASERAAGTITVEVVTGRSGDRPEAVKLLRVAGAAAWWVSLDGRRAGTVRLGRAGLDLVPASGPEAQAAIVLALAQAEGRGTPAVALLPGEAP